MSKERVGSRSMQAARRVLKDLWGSNSYGWRIARIMSIIWVGLVILVLVTAMAFEDSFIYFPAKYPEGVWDVREIYLREGEITAQIEDCWFVTEDRVKLHGWFCTPLKKTGDEMVRVPAEMTLLYLHGNGGNITHRYEVVRMLMALPVRVLIIDYRGYGRSEGAPSEQGLYSDARAAWDYLTHERRVGPEGIIIYGESLGGVPAIDLASKAAPAGMVVQSSFTSIVDMARAVMPFFPRPLIRTKMNSVEKVASVRCPKLFIHSPADEVVPYELGRKLFEAAPEPKQFYEVAGSRHNETHIVGGRAFLSALRGFIESCRRAP